MICHTFSTNDDVSKFTIHTVLLNCNNTYCTYTLLNILSRLTFYFGKKIYESINSNLFFFSPSSNWISFNRFFYKKIRIKFWPFTGSMNVHSLASIKVISKSLQNFHSFIARLLSYLLILYKVYQEDDMLFRMSFFPSTQQNISRWVLPHECRYKKSSTNYLGSFDDSLSRKSPLVWYIGTV